MQPEYVDIQSRWVNALRTQSKSEHPPTGALPCPFDGHDGRIFLNIDQLFDHVRADHASEVKDLEPSQARAYLRDAVAKSRNTYRSSDATAGGGSTLDITGLSLEQNTLRQSPPYSGKKRPAGSDFYGRREKGPIQVGVFDPDYSRDTVTPERTQRLYDPKQSTASPYRSTPELPHRDPILRAQHPQGPARQPGLIELQKYDNRYPGLLLQPDSRPISQEQLASEVKSIYAGLTMVETKCIHVDRAQAAAAAQENSDSNRKLAPDHWQALIALHRTLLHEHHDFFLASQHPSASPALRRLAAKYSMPARMWKHGIHSFLELLRRRLPDSIDYMLAFIYLAYQMMALLYETVPAFENTWIECLGDLGRYRMAIEDEDVRDRETWAGVARSWYSKAADKTPMVGRLYHHLAILARPNALQQMYYYCRSLNSVEPFPSARESIMTLLNPILGRVQASFSHALPIDNNFIMAHAYIFEKSPKADFDTIQKDFLGQLDNHIGRVTAKWKEQGVYIAVTNITGWFDYGIKHNTLRQLFLFIAHQQPNSSSQVVNKGQLRDPPLPIDGQELEVPMITESEIIAELHTLHSDANFSRAFDMTMNTFSLVLRRIGDKNVLPHVHVLLSFLTTLASVQYVAHFIDHAPWTELVSFLNTLIKTENQQNPTQDMNTLLTSPVFSADGEKDGDVLPLPEDYLVRGLIWAQDYLPAKWFGKEQDEEERYLELPSTAKSRTERVLKLGYQLSTVSLPALFA
ncbi:hypothetical protein P153DRAFT_433857 [Dothidotthia symphoricarpi CBS 119687]|uniref:DNA/RNA-binding domain-containing protein n=1 Tax=Dothidotthia symphoricarpi CBS 119687 TaxID=1392245 RepID=A0A6A6A240_9PLEO|nr:uncharacterized protein P153DRAFT_433857 [Dothidotthia symphoricarpi CBS 119687]KAF2126052.1 hypothetical protein P153DRAFT_433857 [Dothidotthia symphoricarpi CBS 119687]